VPRRVHPRWVAAVLQARCGVIDDNPLRYSPAEIAEGSEPVSRIDELRNALLDSDALDSLPAPQPLIDGILYASTLAWLHGKPGCGKSFVALDWAGCIASGLPGCQRGGCDDVAARLRQRTATSAVFRVPVSGAAAGDSRGRVRGPRVRHMNVPARGHGDRVPSRSALGAGRRS
jgi:AAA domain-containing protein